MDKKKIKEIYDYLNKSLAEADQFDKKDYPMFFAQKAGKLQGTIEVALIKLETILDRK